jgi:cytochrome c-type biogenesis protein CcmH
VDSDAGALPDINAMVESLDRRLRDNPDDVAGWKMLGRSYMQLENFDKAVNAFEQALERDGGGDGQTMSDLGEAILMQQHGAIAGRAAAMFESAIAATPNNSKALFYGGIAAVERGDRALAADRWEALLGLSPPPEVQNTLRQRIAEWRGEPLPAADSQDDAVPNKSLAISIALGAAAGDAVSPDATVFVIARDPAMPSPPIAAVRRRAVELPIVVTLSDADAMIPGRLLSTHGELEIIARVSRSGEPLPQPGDWFGEVLINTAEKQEGSILIDRIVE